MNDFDKFLAIPNDEISKKTHILEEFIIHIKNKDYEQIKIQAHFNGFIHSISDEYNLNLDFLVQEYKEFHNLIPPIELGNIDTSINMDTHRSKKEESYIFPNEEEIKENKESSNHYLMIIGGIVLIVFAMSWFIFKDSNDPTIIPLKKEAIQQKITHIQPKVEKIQPKVEKKEELILKKKEEYKYKFDLTKAKKMYDVKDNMLLVEPFRDNKLWLGFIDLNTKKQVGNIIQGLTSYKLESNTIILTGHGYFDFFNKNDDNKPIKYRTLKKLFFYYKNGSLYQVTKEDVLALNGGFTW